MQTHQLVAHPDYPPKRVTGVEFKVTAFEADWLRVRWRIDGAQMLVVPRFAGRGRADELWRTTCFELFLKPLGGEAYCELNLSPSERWNAYDFDGHRQGMRERPFPHEPECTLRQGSTFAIFDAALPLAGLPGQDCALGLAAVLEEEGGVKSYWALSHPEGEPDFHAPACFAVALPAPEAA